MIKIYEIEAEPTVCPAIAEIKRKTGCLSDACETNRSGDFVIIEPAEFFYMDGETRSYMDVYDEMRGPLFCAYDGVLYHIPDDGPVVKATVDMVPHVLLERFFPNDVMTKDEIFKRLVDRGARFYLVEKEGRTYMLINDRLARVACEEAFEMLSELGYLNKDGTLKRFDLDERLFAENDHKQYLLNLHKYVR